MSLLVILGPTAVGKTKLAVRLAYEKGGELISADSRQVYKEMDIGTGKDLEDFKIGSSTIPHHLIDIKEPGEEYNLFDFQRDFYKAYQAIQNRNRQAVLCGGTGLYLEAALSDDKMIEVPLNEKLRTELERLSQSELNDRLISLRSKQHNTTDLEDRQRTIRAIEIENFKQNGNYKEEKSPVDQRIVFGIEMEREALRKRIEDRLKNRLKQGMVEEVEVLMKKIDTSQLLYYGLEYRYITLYLLNKISYEEMYTQLLQAIRKFAKKQMTWYRRMEKKGHRIHWINADLGTSEKLKYVNEVCTNLLKG